MLADVFNGFRNMSLEIHRSVPAYFLSAPRLAWQVTSKKDQRKIRFIN